MEYDYDYIDGIKVSPMVVKNDTILQGERNGSVHVESGTLTIKGLLNGTLDVQNGAKVIIAGKQNGTVLVANNSEILILGELFGTTVVSEYGTIIIETHGKLAGTLNNNGTVIIRGVFGGAQSGQGKIVFEKNGYIKQPIIKNGINCYER